MSVAAVRLPRRAGHVVERNFIAYQHQWLIFVSGFAEPVLYLLGIGFGIGSLVRNISIGDGHSVSYAMFVAPALMAFSAMNGAMIETTFNFFYKVRYAKTFDAVIATPLEVEDAVLGEVIWAVARGSVYSVGFVVLMLALGLIASPLALLAIPAAVLVGLAFAALGAAVMTFMRSWQDFDLVNLALQPMFLFSGTFFPIAVYPEPLRVVIQWTPLYHGVNLIRGLTTGTAGPAQFGDIAYLVGLALLGVGVAGLRLRRQLLK
jgi:lipooligosaccharide transport system permease protein